MKSRKNGVWVGELIICQWIVTTTDKVEVRHISQVAPPRVIMSISISIYPRSDENLSQDLNEK